MAKLKPHLDRLLGKGPILFNQQAIYACYTSGAFNGFFASKKEAEEHASALNQDSEWEYGVMEIEMFDLCKPEDDVTAYFPREQGRDGNGVLTESDVPFVTWCSGRNEGP